MRNTAVAATALLAALSLTACQSADDDAKKPSASAPTTSAPAADTTGPTTDAKTPAADTAKQPTTGTKPTSAGKGKTGGGTGTDTGPVTTACTDANTKVTVTKVSRPINHLLLTVTNTGSKACNAYHAPLLRIDEGQAVTRIMDESKPQAVVTLSPGQSGYASILLSAADGSGENGRTAKTLGVLFAPRNGSGSIGSPHVLTLPANTYTDDSVAVSYWQTSMSDALMY
ncbi:DUF4232 domain-containing protein [Streptomyces sp. NBC_01481]|uniref:DUF4232 domain-containing protein n=1 Tax=Streptomyces sp. NBC_01481 TaxID=2975869 RepID=UPI00225014EB|nr:DUF4232 domain-containing protein [Streptomyces sp. NBC_01481]MCX4583643.1 DUF4232 domain-containing protein [Streptomyces sp. NBC_01481]